MNWDRRQLDLRIAPNAGLSGPWQLVMQAFATEALAPLGISVDAVPDGPVVTLDVAYMTIAEALDRLCGMAGHTWAIEHNRLIFDVP